MSFLKKKISFFIYKAIVWVLFYVCLFFFRIETEGKEKVIKWKKENKTSYVAVSRHKSFWDPIFMPIAFGTSEETMMNYVAKKELSGLLNLIPISKEFITFIDRKKTRKSTIEKSSDLLTKGTNLAIFPEGTTIPERKEMKRGIILIIRRAQEKMKKKIPIFPLNIKSIGPYGKPEGKWYYYLLRKVKIKMKIGPPLFLEDLEREIGKNLKQKDKEKEMVRLILEKTDQI